MNHSGMNEKKIGLVFFYCTQQGEKVSHLLMEWDDAPLVELRKVALPCSGKLEVFFLLKALENGAEGVALLGCPEEECRYFIGSERAKNRLRITGKLLGEIGLERDRVRRFVLKKDAGSTDIDALRQWIEYIKGLNPFHRDSEGCAG